MTLNSFFDRIYCINLPQRQDRRAHCERVFAELDWKVEFFSATSGSPVLAPVEVDRKHCALKMAQISILSWALLYGYQKILIFEDDILVAKNVLVELPLFLAELPPDWDLCYLGWMDWLDHRSEPVSEHCQRIRELNGAHAVGFSPSIMVDCIRAQAQMDCHADTALARYIQIRGHAYSPMKNLVSQGCFGSNLTLQPMTIQPERLKEFV